MRPDTAKVGDVVWYRTARMYGAPTQQAMRAMVTNVRADGRVDLEIGCEGMGITSGTASAVQHISKLRGSQIENGMCWWHGILPPPLVDA